MTDCLGSALQYAARGWAGFPVHSVHNGLCSCGKPACSSAGKHPHTASGLKDATTDAEVIRQFWRKWPNANIGIRTGTESGLVVLDLDCKNGLDGVHAAREVRGGEPGNYPHSRTGGGGLHVFFKHPGFPVKNRCGAGAIAPGVEVKGDGGCIIAPPSVHSSGERYEWVREPDGELPPCPDWLLAELRKSPQPEWEAIEEGQVIPKTQRNSTLTSLAGVLRRRGASENTIEVALLSENAQRCRPPLPEAEVRAIARSVGRYEPAERPGSVLTFNCTDSGNAALVAALYGGGLRYDHRRGRWLVWESHWWIEDPDGKPPPPGAGGGPVALQSRRRCGEPRREKAARDLGNPFRKPRCYPGGPCACPEHAPDCRRW